ncbi:MAG: hypothetical protein ACFB2Z_00165 [Maricaulaceae bacterium]
MRISHQHRFVFVSRPHCASSAVRQWLDPYCDEGSDAADVPQRHDHPFMGARKIYDRLVADTHDPETYFFFTTLRNPWDLVVSAYVDARPDCAGRTRTEPEHQPGRPSDFETWVMTGRTWSTPLDTWLDTVSALSVRHSGFGPQGKQIVQGFYPIEQWSRLVRDLRRLFGLPLAEPPPRVNPGARGPDYRAYYTDASRDRVAELFALDIELGGYDF